MVIELNFNSIVPIGKHKGLEIVYVVQHYPTYILWASQNWKHYTFSYYVIEEAKKHRDYEVPDDYSEEDLNFQ